MRPWYPRRGGGPNHRPDPGGRRASAGRRRGAASNDFFARAAVAVAIECDTVAPFSEAPVRNNTASFILGSFLIVAAAATTAASTAGCDGGTGGGGGEGGGANAACFDYSAFDGMSPAVSFQADVLPFFQQSCGVSTACHGDINEPNENRPYLGPNMSTTPTQAEIDAIFASIVGVTSFYEPAMNIVKASDPENSFLMYKIDGMLECDKLECAGNKDCGGIMPQGVSEPVEQASRDKVRRWIAQGAQNN
jgi:hypothetical protein